MKPQLVALSISCILAACTSHKEVTESQVKSILIPEEPIVPIPILDTTDYGFERVYLNQNVGEHLFIPDNMGMRRESSWKYDSIAPLTFEEIPPETFAEHYQAPPEVVPSDKWIRVNHLSGAVGQSLQYFEPLDMYILTEVAPPQGNFAPDMTSLIDSTNRITYHLVVGFYANCNNVIASPDNKHLVYYGNTQVYQKAFMLGVAEVTPEGQGVRLKSKALQKYEGYTIMGYAWIDNNTLALSLYKKDLETQKGVNKFVKTTL